MVREIIDQRKMPCLPWISQSPHVEARAIAYIHLLWVISFAWVVSAFGGCAQPPISAPDESLRVPRGIIDLGHIPIDGTQIDISLENVCVDTIQITRVKSRCGCAVAKAPDMIPAGSHAPMTIQLRGQIKPTRKNAMVLLETDVGQRSVIRIAFSTGHTPVLDPPLVSLTRRGDRAYIGRGFIWLYAPADESVFWFRVDDEGDSGVRIHVPTHSNYVCDDGRRLQIHRKGLQLVGFDILVLPGDLQTIARDLVVIEVKQGKRWTSLPVRLELASPRLLSVTPDQVTMAFRSNRELVAQKRVFTLNASEPVECAIVRSPSNAESRLTRIDSTTWKLTVQITEMVSGRESITFDVEAKGLTMTDRVAIPIRLVDLRDGLAK